MQFKLGTKKWRQITESREYVMSCPKKVTLHKLNETALNQCPCNDVFTVLFVTFLAMYSLLIPMQRSSLLKLQFSKLLRLCKVERLPCYLFILHLKTLTLVNVLFPWLILVLLLLLDIKRCFICVIWKTTNFQHLFVFKMTKRRKNPSMDLVHTIITKGGRVQRIPKECKLGVKKALRHSNYTSQNV